MQKLSIPFNISLLDVNESVTSRFRRISSLDIFDGSTTNFHTEGLYSTTTFGVVGSDVRSTRYGYIDLKISIIHPTYYKSLVQVKRLYAGIMASKEFARWDPLLKDFVKADILEGETGFQFFIEHVDEIDFGERSSNRRDQNISFLLKYRGKQFTDKIICMPAGLRDIEMDDYGRPTSDEVNDFYKRLLYISNTINLNTVKVSPEAYNSQRISLQNTFNELYDFLSSIIEGKKNLMMGKWASRKVFNGTRNVISSMNNPIEELGDKRSAGFNDTHVGLYQLSKAMLPVTLHHLRNGFLSEVFTSNSETALLTNPKTMMSERVMLTAETYSYWLSAEGLEKFITRFQESSIRHNPILIEGFYVGLIYKGPDGTFKLLHGIDELPTTRSKKDCSPITFAELIYLSLYQIANNYPIFITRYPITGIGSIYPSKVFLKTTINTEARTPLNQDWEIDEQAKVATEFPIRDSSFFNSLSPHSSRLSRMSADFDGDTSSASIVYTDEAIEECNSFLNSKRAYVGADGNFVYDCNTDTIKYVLHNLTGD